MIDSGFFDTRSVQASPLHSTLPPSTPPLSSAADLGAALRRLRVRQGLKQGDVAAQTGLRIATISAIENGAQGTRIDTLMTLAVALGYDFTLRRIEG